MKKTIFGIMLLIIIFDYSYAQSDPEEDFLARPSNDGKSVIITGYVGKKWAVNIPSTIQNLPVTHIGNSAFGFKNLISVTIPNGITHIGDAAFRDNKLSSVTIPDSVTYIGEAAFMSNILNSIIIPDGVTYIGDNAFQFQKMTYIEIPKSVTKCGELFCDINGEWRGGAFPYMTNEGFPYVLDEIWGTSNNDPSLIPYRQYYYKPGNYVYSDGLWNFLRDKIDQKINGIWYGKFETSIEQITFNNGAYEGIVNDILAVKGIFFTRNGKLYQKISHYHGDYINKNINAENANLESKWHSEDDLINLGWKNTQPLFEDFCGDYTITGNQLVYKNNNQENIWLKL